MGRFWGKSLKWLGRALAGLVLGLPALAADKAHLVDAKWLEGNLGGADIVLLDASPAKAYGAGHIPGAINVDIFGFAGREPSAADMERRIRSWGIGPGKKVVAYDAGGTYLATSLVFELYYHGVPADSLAVLDGGLARWRAAGGPVTKDATPPPSPGTFRATLQREDVRVRLPEFLVASGDPAGAALVEALEPAMHFGGTRFFDRAGHVPNAIMVPAADFFNDDKTFKSPAEIRRMLDYLGIDPGKAVYAHCGGGIAASVPFFAMKFLLDYPRVKLYKESQLEWLRDDRGLPFWTYDAPNLARDKAWLAGWNSAMLRGFGVSRLAVIDVRGPEAFRRSHIPFAVNIPAAEFRAHLGAPAKLAETLRAAGVDAAHEAVIVSDGGLNPDSALAFLALEKLGQKRVSVLSDSVEDWGFAGYPLAKAGEAADARTPPMPPAAPTAYAAAPRPGLWVGDAHAARGPYPRVYIAAGKALPAKVPEGKVIRLPYGELVQANGTPKAAKDIWAALAKAGVPRYAELVSIAEDPGEAAAAYFVLRLMGFPDVKVLVM